MKLFNTLFLVLFFASITFGQAGKLKRADNYYKTLAYALAAEQYEGLLGSDVDSPGMKAKLATCYFQMGNTQKAETVFSQMIQEKEATPENVYNYAQSLKENGKYTESDEWMKKFVQMNGDDVRAKDFQQKQNYLELIEKQGIHFSVKHLNVNTSTTDFGGYPTANQESIYFVSSRADRTFVNNIWTWNNSQFLDVHAGEKTAELEIDQPKMVTKRVNSRYHEGPMCFSADGKTVYFTRNNISKGSRRNDEKGIQNLKMYIATIDAKGNWVNENEFSLNSREYSIGHPTLSADGKFLYFASDMPGGFGGADLYRIPVYGNGSFGKAENLGPEINTEGQEMFPWLNAEGYLFFSSDGKVGLGGLDVFVAIPDGKKMRILNVGKPVNSQKDDFAFTMLADNKTGYFSSNREGGLGDDDIYSYQLTKPFIVQLSVSGIAMDKETGVILPGATVDLKDEAGKVLASTLADEKGGYSFPVEPEMNYTIQAKQPKYFDNVTAFSSKNLPEGTTELKKDIALEKDPGLALLALVTDTKTGLPLPGVRIELKDNNNKSIFIDEVSGETGAILKGLTDKKVNDALSYTIVLSKEGYLTKTVQFATKIEKPGVINVHEKLDLSLGKIEVGLDLATLIDIKPIYFDYGKFAIRPDAAKELDKIVKVMNDYPTMVIELGSHTDCRGSIASNTKLSDNRAKASAAYIRAKIKNPERIDGKGYGETKLKNGCGCEGPVKSTCSETEHQENRRTEFIIMKM